MSHAEHHSHDYRWLLSIVLLVCASCLDTASSSNDNSQSIAGTGGAGTAASGGAGAPAGPAGTGGTGIAGSGPIAGAGVAGMSSGAAGLGNPPAAGSGVTAGTSAGASGSGASGSGVAGAGVAGESAAGSGAAGMTGAAGGGTGEAGSPAAGSGAAGAPSTAPDPSLVKGTGTSCSSYGAPANGKCGGYFCGTDLATLQKAVDPMAKCGGGIELLCQNSVVTKVGMCARTVKSAMPLGSNEELRPMIESCVFEDAMIKAVTSSACLACTIDAAQCAGDNCLIQCLAGDSAQCDACRKDNNCDAPVFSCGGLPTPF